MIFMLYANKGYLKKLVSYCYLILRLHSGLNIKELRKLVFLAKISALLKITTLFVPELFWSRNKSECKRNACNEMPTMDDVFMLYIHNASL